jgi:hypothetical protein
MTEFPDTTNFAACGGYRAEIGFCRFLWLRNSGWPRQAFSPFFTALRAPPIPLQWPAVTHGRPPIAPEWWAQDIPQRTIAPLAPVRRLSQRPVPWPSIEPPRSPPSFTPRRLAAAKPALVRAEIIPVSSSAPPPFGCNRNLPVAPSIIGRSANRTARRLWHLSLLHVLQVRSREDGRVPPRHPFALRRGRTD